MFVVHADCQPVCGRALDLVVADILAQLLDLLLAAEHRVQHRVLITADVVFLHVFG